MSNNLERTTKAYIGRNKAHRQFVQKIVNEKIFVYIIMKNKDTLVSKVFDEFDEMRKMQHGEFALGIVTKGISNTQFRAIFIRENESSLIAKDTETFQSQIYGKAYTEVHRIFVDYTIDLINEVLSKIPKPNNYGDLSYKKNREKVCGDYGINILTDKALGTSSADELRDRLNYLENTRHIIEHNIGIVDMQFLDRVPKATYRLGEKIDISPGHIGEAIALVETLAEDLNKRTLGRYFSYLT